MKILNLTNTTSTKPFTLDPIYIVDLHLMLLEVKENREKNYESNQKLALGSLLTYFCIEVCYRSQAEFGESLPINIKNNIINELLEIVYPIDNDFPNQLINNIEMQLNLFPDKIVEMSIEYCNTIKSRIRAKKSNF